MTTEMTIIPARRIWLIAILVASLFAIPIAILVENHPWAMAIPITIGTIAVLLSEMRPAHRHAKQLPLISMPKYFLGLARYKGYIALNIPIERENPNQELFEFLNHPRKKMNRTARLVKDPETGEAIYLIEADRFVTLLLNKLLPTTDKATEVSLTHALQRYGEMQNVSGELERFLRDRTVQEVIKSDFRGNIAQTVNRCGEAIIRELVKESKEKKDELAARR